MTNKLGPVNELLRGFQTPGAHRCPPIFGQFLPNHLNMLETMLEHMYISFIKIG